MSNPNLIVESLHAVAAACESSNELGDHLDGPIRDERGAALADLWEEAGQVVEGGRERGFTLDRTRQLRRHEDALVDATQQTCLRIGNCERNGERRIRGADHSNDSVTDR